jgi:hypothetical protein
MQAYTELRWTGKWSILTHSEVDFSILVAKCNTEQTVTTKEEGWARMSARQDVLLLARL